MIRTPSRAVPKNSSWKQKKDNPHHATFATTDATRRHKNMVRAACRASQPRSQHIARLLYAGFLVGSEMADPNYGERVMPG
jgi:hypothetical protein